MAASEKSQIRVVGVGLPRTGTASLQRALQILGFACHHMVTDVLSDTFPFRKARRWLPILESKDTDFRQDRMRAIYEDGGYSATVDFPGSILADDLVKLYPQAKFILSVRKSPAAWRTSFNNTLDITRTPWFLAATYLLPSQTMVLQPMALYWEQINSARYDGAQIYRNESTDIYVRHNQWIRDIVPGERLLEHESSQGWKPLCEFLGVDVPENVPYPHVNDTEDIRKYFYIGAAFGCAVWLGYLALFLGAIWWYMN